MKNEAHRDTDTSDKRSPITSRLKLRGDWRPGDRGAGRDGCVHRFHVFSALRFSHDFCRLAGSAKGGSFQLAPMAGEFRHKQRYLPDTNILLTRFLGESGIAAISDFMAMQHLGHSHNLVRRVKIVRGEIKFRMACAPKFDYGRTGHTIEKKPREIIFVPENNIFPPCACAAAFL